MVSSLFLAHIPVRDFRPPTFLSQLSKLTELRISSRSQLFKDPNDWKPLLHSLPSTLESLTIDSKDSNLAFTINPKIERGRAVFDSQLEYMNPEIFFPRLKSLTIAGSQLSLKQFSALPSGLTSLTASGKFSLSTLSQLPRSMTELNVDTEGDLNIPERLELDGISNLPPGLIIKQFNVDSRFPDVIIKLAGLQGLLSARLYATDVFPDTHLLLMPTSLTKLQLSAVLNDIWAASIRDAASIWPPSLKSLEIRCMQSLGILALLPRHLTELTLSILGMRPSTASLYADELPPHLKILLVSSLRPVQIEGKLPSSLVRFRVHPQLETGDLSALPESIEDLQISMPTDTPLASAALAFPLRVSRLSMSSWRVQNLGDLPPTLTTFEVFSLQHLWTRECIVFSLLPSSLTKLQIRGLEVSRNSDWQNRVRFPFNAGELPFLRELLLAERINLPTASLRNLPHSLTSFIANMENLLVDESSIASLPPNLVHCSLGVDMSRFEDLGELWPPGSWRSLVGTAAARLVPHLRERLAASQSLARSSKLE